MIFGLGQKMKASEGSAFYQYLATITGCLGVVSTSMHFGWPSPTLPYLLSSDSHIKVTSEDGSWLATMPCIGAISGSLMTAYFVDKIGRKTCLLGSAPGHFIAWVMVAFATTIWELYAARFLAGWADGLIFTAFPMYLGEIASYDIRGLLGSSLQLTMIAGMLIINILGAYVNIMNTALISSLVAPVFFVTFWFMPDSPYYLVMKGRVEDATKSLKLLRQTSDVSDEINRIIDAVNEEKKQSGKYYELFTVASNRKAAIIVFGLRAIQQFGGTTVITFYAQSIFHEASGDMSPTIATIIFFTLQLICAVSSSFLLDSVGRKPLLIISIIGSGLMLSLEGTYFFLQTNTNLDISSLKVVPLVALLGYVVIFNIGMGVIPVLFLGEMFPTSVKAFALCLADIWFGLIVTIVSKFFQIMQDDFGISVPFFAFAACCALGLIFILIIVPETKGKTLEDIQMELKGIKKETPDQNNCTA